MQQGINAVVVPLTNDNDLVNYMANNPQTTHCVVAAPWIKTATLSYLCDTYPRCQFLINCHSNVGFLQADSNGIQLVREAIQLEAGKYNFHLAGNNAPFCESIIEGYGAPCTYLPNLYYLDNTSVQVRPIWSAGGGNPLRLGVFGATRWLKNFCTAVMAAVITSRSLKAQTQIYINSARVDGPEVARIMRSAQNLIAGLPNVQMIPVPWAAWPDFRGWVDSMHCCIQPSYTESFNLVTADAASRQVPSAVSPAITWTPKDWQVDVDNAPLLARCIVALVQDPQAGFKGLQALMAHNSQGVDAWLQYLVADRFGTGPAAWTGLGIPKHYRLAHQPQLPAGHRAG